MFVEPATVAVKTYWNNFISMVLRQKRVIPNEVGMTNRAPKLLSGTVQAANTIQPNIPPISRDRLKKFMRPEHWMWTSAITLNGDLDPVHARAADWRSKDFRNISEHVLGILA